MDYAKLYVPADGIDIIYHILGEYLSIKWSTWYLIQNDLTN